MCRKRATSRVVHQSSGSGSATCVRVQRLRCLVAAGAVGPDDRDRDGALACLGDYVGGPAVAPGGLAILQVSDRVSVPGPGLRLRRAVLASGGGGALYVDTLKNKRARTVPLVEDLVPVVERWSAGKAPGAWLFNAPQGGPLRESNWKRSVGWSAATAAAGVPGFRVHHLRHTAASVWLPAGAD